MRSLIRAGTALLALTVALASGCTSDEPTDATPEGALRLFIQSMRRYDRDQAFSLLAPASQNELRQRATEASRQAGREIEPAEMLIVERFVSRWEISEMQAETDGDRATITALGAEPSQRAEVELRRVDGHWRLLLPL